MVCAPRRATGRYNVCGSGRAGWRAGGRRSSSRRAQAHPWPIEIAGRRRSRWSPGKRQVSTLIRGNRTHSLDAVMHLEGLRCSRQATRGRGCFSSATLISCCVTAGREELKRPGRCRAVHAQRPAQRYSVFLAGRGCGYRRSPGALVKPVISDSRTDDSGWGAKDQFMSLPFRRICCCFWTCPVLNEAC